ncbi:MAG: hypothetical protein KF852_13840 [Saprospiraceae bacterium]|nr:hypothetical protein [Saprospiraceae bacterium]
MDRTFKKMNFKSEPEVLILQAPDSFGPNMQAMAGLTTFKTDISQVEKIRFAIAFVTRQEEIDAYMEAMVGKLEGDCAIWFCYPKGSSKKYRCDFNRDTGWAIMGRYSLEPVRQVAIDEDWSALRFRKVAYIKNITRRESFALSEEAKRRTDKKGE